MRTSESAGLTCVGTFLAVLLAALPLHAGDEPCSHINFIVQASCPQGRILDSSPARADCGIMGQKGCGSQDSAEAYLRRPCVLDGEDSLWFSIDGKMVQHVDLKDSIRLQVIFDHSEIAHSYMVVLEFDPQQLHIPAENIVVYPHDSTWQYMVFDSLDRYLIVSGYTPYFPAGLQPGKDSLFSALIRPVQLSEDTVFISDHDCVGVPVCVVNFNVEEASSGEEADHRILEVYDAAGRKVSRPGKPGIYFERSYGGKVNKVLRIGK